MSRTPFLKRVVLENYKSIAACDVLLEPLTYLVGANGAGKTNFLDALRFLSDGLTHSLEWAVRERGGIRQIVHHPGGTAARLGIRVEFLLASHVRGFYALQIAQEPVDRWFPAARWAVVEEECRLLQSGDPEHGVFFHVRDGQVTTSARSQPAVTSDRLFLVGVSGFPEFRPVLDALTGMKLYDVQAKSIPDFEAFDPSSYLASDGTNLASVLAVLRSTDPPTFERLKVFLQALLPGLTRVLVEPVFSSSRMGETDNNSIALIFEQVIGKSVGLFGPKQMSEGTLRTLAILVALYQLDGINRHRPTLVGIEDIEAAVHPAALGVLVDALEEASLSTQVLVTTHSPELLDKRPIAGESLLSVSAKDGVTRIGPIDAACRSALYERLFTAGDLLRMGQLTPESSTVSPPEVTPDGAPGKEARTA